MIAAGLVGSQRASEDLTCYTSPVVHVTYQWPSSMGDWAISFYVFACIFIGVMVVWFWRTHRPCAACGEFESQCRCKQRDYPL